MSSLAQDDDHQISDFLLLIWECDMVDMRGAKVSKECWYCKLCGNEYNLWNSTKELMHMTISGGPRIA